MEIFRKFIFIIICLSLSPSLFARDINLDEIYIKKTSRYNKRLIQTKLDTYQKINAIFIDRNVIFAWWISGNEILYIKEFPKSNLNLICRYHLIGRRSIELRRLRGVITIAQASPNGRYLILKRLIQKNRIIPEGERIIFNIKSKKFKISKSPYAFLDFSIPLEGNSIIYEIDKKLIELSLYSSISSVLLNRESYSDIVLSKNPSIAYFSPDRQKFLVINGSGGHYRSKMFYQGGTERLTGISSSSELFWIDNNRIAFRKGYTGNFSVVLYDIQKMKSVTLLKKSFNTNIFYSQHPKILSFLKEQLILIYSISEDRLIKTGIEGEDISFAPNGIKFSSLAFKKLFIINIETLKKKRIELKRSWRSILSIYKALKKNRRELMNEYSIHYINRKIDAYKSLIGI